MATSLIFTACVIYGAHSLHCHWGKINYSYSILTAWNLKTLNQKLGIAVDTPCRCRSDACGKTERLLILIINIFSSFILDSWYQTFASLFFLATAFFCFATFHCLRFCCKWWKLKLGFGWGLKGLTFWRKWRQNVQIYLLTRNYFERHRD